MVGKILQKSPFGKDMMLVISEDIKVDNGNAVIRLSRNVIRRIVI